MEADRQRAIELIEEAVTAGARRFRVGQILQIDVRTLQRWKQALKRSVLCDQRKVAAQARTPGNALTLTERAGAPVYALSQVHPSDMGDLTLILVLEDETP